MWRSPGRFSLGHREGEKRGRKEAFEDGTTHFPGTLMFGERGRETDAVTSHHTLSYPISLYKAQDTQDARQDAVNP